MGLLDTLVLDQRRALLNAQHYFSIAYPLPREELEDFAEKGLAFFNLEEEVKKQFSYNFSSNHQSEVGYMPRKAGQIREGNVRKDEKNVFHYHESAEERYKTLAVAQDPVPRAFLAAAKKVHGVTVETMSEVLRIFSLEFPDLRERILPGGKATEVYLRLIDYLADSAADHYDVGGITMAIAESAPGLYIGSGDKDTKPVIHEPGKAIVFPGYQLHQYTGGPHSAYIPAWHGVAASGKRRWAIVCFFDDHTGGKKSTYAQAHTPYSYLAL